MVCEISVLTTQKEIKRTASVNVGGDVLNVDQINYTGWFAARILYKRPFLIQVWSAKKGHDFFTWACQLGTQLLRK